MKIRRNDDGVVYGDLDVGGTFPATVRSDLAPVLVTCGTCVRQRWHVVAVQKGGLVFKIPFARKPLASSHKAVMFVCNTCLDTSTDEDGLVEKLEAGIVAAEICNDLDYWKNGRLCFDCKEMYLLPTENCQNCGGPIVDEDDEEDDGYVPEAYPKPYTKLWKELEVKEGLSTPSGGDCNKWLDAYRREDHPA